MPLADAVKAVPGRFEAILKCHTNFHNSLGGISWDGTDYTTANFAAACRWVEEGVVNASCDSVNWLGDCSLEFDRTIKNLSIVPDHIVPEEVNFLIVPSCARGNNDGARFPVQSCFLSMDESGQWVSHGSASQLEAELAIHEHYIKEALWKCLKKSIESGASASFSAWQDWGEKEYEASMHIALEWAADKIRGACQTNDLKGRLSELLTLN